MTIESIPIHRTGLTLRADPSRVLVRPFMPHTEERAAKICQRVHGWFGCGLPAYGDANSGTFGSGGLLLSGHRSA